MSGVAIGQPVPDFECPATGEKSVRLSELKGKNVVLYFYPKDNTPGCTTEGLDFQQRLSEFAALDTIVLGVSRDTLRSHDNFRAKHGFDFDLLSDSEESLCKLFDVIKLKKMYGRESLGVERSTFLIDADGVLRNEWRKIKVKGHGDEVLEATRALA